MNTDHRLPVNSLCNSSARQHRNHFIVSAARRL
uniref:Uncharacterized protein n=1 Tax=Anguilla anguilla TaxID=7936 RepID=A0A0E9UEG7_ANGAN